MVFAGVLRDNLARGTCPKARSRKPRLEQAAAIWNTATIHVDQRVAAAVSTAAVAMVDAAAEEEAVRQSPQEVYVARRVEAKLPKAVGIEDQAQKKKRKAPHGCICGGMCGT